MLKKILLLNLCLLLLFSTLVQAEDDVEISGETITIYENYEFEGEKLYHGKDASGLWWGSYAEEIVRNYWIDYDDSVDIDDKFKQKTNFNIETKNKEGQLGLELGLDNDINSGDNNFNVDDENKSFELEEARGYFENDRFSLQVGDLKNYTITDYFFSQEDLSNAIEAKAKFNNFNIKALYGAETNYGEVVEVLGDPNHYSDAVKYQKELAALMSDQTALGQLFVRRQFNYLSSVEQEEILGAIETALQADPTNTDLMKLKGLLAPSFGGAEETKVSIIAKQLRLSNEAASTAALNAGVNGQIANINTALLGLESKLGTNLASLPEMNLKANDFNKSDINVYDREAELTTYYKALAVGTTIASTDVKLKALDVSERIRTLMNGTREGDTTYSLALARELRENLVLNGEYAVNEGSLISLGADLSLFDDFTTIKAQIKRIDKDFDLVREDDDIFEKNTDEQKQVDDTTEYNLQVKKMPLVVPVLFGEADITYDDELSAQGGLTYVVKKDKLFLQGKYTYEGAKEEADVLETGLKYTPNQKFNLTLAAGRKFDYRDMWIDTTESADVDNPIDYRREVDVTLFRVDGTYNFTPQTSLNLLVSKLFDEDDNQGVRVASNFKVQF